MGEAAGSAPCDGPGPHALGSLEELAFGAQDGDREAMDQLLGRLRPKIVRYCRARISEPQSTHTSADDVAQEALIGVLHALPNYRPDGPGFLAFSYGITAHKVADFHRKRSSDRSFVVAEMPDHDRAAPGPEVPVLRGETQHWLRAVLDTLTPLQREVVTLRMVVGLSSEETAQAVERSPGAVRVTQHRALAAMRAQLDGVSDLAAD